MDLTVEEYIEGLLTKDSLKEPSDTVKVDHLGLDLPPWWDEDKFNRGRKFYKDNAFSFGTCILHGVLAAFAIPTILKVLVGSKRSSSTYTAYKRYASTTFHIFSWFEHELKPGSTSWKSLFAIRSRHLRGGLASKLKGGDVVSQRDIAFTQWAFFSFALVKSDKFGISQRRAGEWEDYLFVWRTLGYMLGLKDRYNMCRKTEDETRQVCQIILDRVYTPCLDNVPEFFEHMSKVYTDGTWIANQSLNYQSAMYWTRYIAGVPGYIYTEEERINLQKKLKEKLKGKPLNTGVDSRELMSEPATAITDGLPDRPPRLLYLRDYDSLDTVPEYKRLSFGSKCDLALKPILVALYSTYLGKLVMNWLLNISMWVMRHFPYMAFIKFGFKRAFVDMFVETPHDETKPKTNAEIYSMKPKPCWYLSWIDIFW